MEYRIKQFDFGRNWKKKIVPILENPFVLRALHMGLLLQGDDYEPGDPPWLHGRGPINGQRAKEGCLSWYQPWGRCHYIAPFSWAIGKELFPDLKWGFITSNTHTIAIGYEEDWGRPEWVMDILLFRKKSAEESLDFAKGDGWKLYRSFCRYAASFFPDPEGAEAAFVEKSAS